MRGRAGRQWGAHRDVLEHDHAAQEPQVDVADRDPGVQELRGPGGEDGPEDRGKCGPQHEQDPECHEPAPSPSRHPAPRLRAGPAGVNEPRGHRRDRGAGAPCSPYHGGERRRLPGGGRTVIRVVVVSLC